MVSNERREIIILFWKKVSEKLKWFLWNQKYFFFSYNIDQQKQNKTKIYLFKFWISYAKYVLREKKGEREKERERERLQLKLSNDEKIRIELLYKL